MDDTTAARMRTAETYHTQTIPPGVPFVVRVDGRSFSRLTEAYDKPFDIRFHQRMRQVARTLTDEFGGTLCYTQSDEASVLLNPPYDLFNRSVDKLTSLTAATATAAFLTADAELPDSVDLAEIRPTFDARIVVLPDVDHVVQYFCWRQADAWRCAVNTLAYWTARNLGMSPRRADQTIRGPQSEKHEFLHAHDVNANDLPVWARRGVLAHQQTYTKIGHNPMTGQDVEATRQRINIDDQIGYGDQWATQIRKLASGHVPHTNN